MHGSGTAGCAWGACLQHGQRRLAQQEHRPRPQQRQHLAQHGGPLRRSKPSTAAARHTAAAAAAAAASTSSSASARFDLAAIEMNLAAHAGQRQPCAQLLAQPCGALRRLLLAAAGRHASRAWLATARRERRAGGGGESRCDRRLAQRLVGQKAQRLVALVRAGGRTACWQLALGGCGAPLE